MKVIQTFFNLIAAKITIFLLALEAIRLSKDSYQSPSRVILVQSRSALRSTNRRSGTLAVIAK